MDVLHYRYEHKHVISLLDARAEGSVVAVVRNRLRRHRLKSKTVSAANGIELVLEVRVKDGQGSLVNEISALDGVTNTVMVSYNGEYAL